MHQHDEGEEKFKRAENSVGEEPEVELASRRPTMMLEHQNPNAVQKRLDVCHAVAALFGIIDDCEFQSACAFN